MAYKILYLPTAEEITIYQEMPNAFLLYNVNEVKERPPPYHLSAPKSLILNLPTCSESAFKVAIFHSKSIARSWINELITRDTCQGLNMRLEHFEIIKVEFASR